MNLRESFRALAATGALMSALEPAHAGAQEVISPASSTCEAVKNIACMDITEVALESGIALRMIRVLRNRSPHETQHLKAGTQANDCVFDLIIGGSNSDSVQIRITCPAKKPKRLRNEPAEPTVSETWPIARFDANGKLMFKAYFESPFSVGGKFNPLTTRQKSAVLSAIKSLEATIREIK